MVAVATRRRIEAPPERVWAEIADLDSWAAKLPTVTEIERIGERTGEGAPIDLGVRYRVSQPGLPNAEYQVTRWDEQQGFTWVSSRAGVTTTADHQVLRLPSGGSELHLTITWSGIMASMVRLIVGSKTKRMIADEARTFALLAERHVGDAA